MILVDIDIEGNWYNGVPQDRMIRTTLCSYCKEEELVSKKYNIFKLTFSNGVILKVKDFDGNLNHFTGINFQVRILIHLIINTPKLIVGIY